MLQNHKHTPFTPLVAGAVVILLLSACAAQNIPPTDRSLKAAATTSPPVATQAARASAAPANVQSQAQAIADVLAYADKVRTLPPADLNAELNTLANAASPAEQLQLSLALSQVHQNAELIRAQDIVTRVLANEAPEAKALHPLARLLASRYAEQRRLEDQVEKQSQQLRDVQRKLDQSNERLEALKAIERSLSNRPPPLASPPAKAVP